MTHQNHRAPSGPTGWRVSLHLGAGAVRLDGMDRLRFAPVLEARFRMDATLVLQGRPWDAVLDYHRDQLRWAWRKFLLDRRKPAAWDAKARAIMLDLASRGPVKVDDLLHATRLGAACAGRRASMHGVRVALPHPAWRDRARVGLAGRGAN